MIFLKTIIHLGVYWRVQQVPCDVRYGATKRHGSTKASISPIYEAFTFCQNERGINSHTSKSLSQLFFAKISSRDARDTRDGDRERYHIPDRERERERFHERERAPVVVAEPRPALASTSGGEEPELLVRQNHDLRRRLDEESQSYKRRLETYKQAQAHQAALVSRLQAKILQYKQRCNDLEGQLEPVGSDSPVARGSLGHLPPPPIDDHDLDPDAALRLLDDERKKNERMKQLNSQLKQQLDESIGTNEGLTTDLQKLHADWERLRDELVAKEEVCVLLVCFACLIFLSSCRNGKKRSMRFMITIRVSMGDCWGSGGMWCV